MTATGHSDLLDELGNAHADDVTGSGPKNATGHAKSGSGETGIDPRTKTGHPENASVQAETGSDPKTATDRDVTAREGAQRVFVPIEIRDKINPTGRSHREDSNQTPERWRKSLRSDRGLRQARPGRVTPSRRLDAKTEAEIPKELSLRTPEEGQMGRAGEDTPEPTNWRGSTMNAHSQS